MRLDKAAELGFVPVDTRLVNPTGRLGIAAVFTATDAAPAADGGHADGSLHVPWAALFNKGVTVGFGRTHDRRHTTHLRDMIISGRARPGMGRSP